MSTLSPMSSAKMRLTLKVQLTHLSPSDPARSHQKVKLKLGLQLEVYLKGLRCIK